MIEADAFAQRPRGVPLAAANDARFLRVIVMRVRSRAQRSFANRILDGVRDFVRESERRRLRAAARSAQRAIWIPRDGLRCRIEVIVAAMIDGHAKRSLRGLEPVEQAALAGVARQIAACEVVIRPRA